MMVLTLDLENFFLLKIANVLEFSSLEKDYFSI